ncbi:MAG: SGNH/GDSL hydrolase family protein [Prevotella sp.]
MFASNNITVSRLSLDLIIAAFLCTAGINAATAQCRKHATELNVVMLGDSNTWIGGDSCNLAKGWNKWFRDEFAPASCRSYARSGATWTNTEATVCNTADYTEKLGDDNVVYNQINRLAEAVASGGQTVPDLIIIAAGTNDAWFSGKRPLAFSKTADEAFAGTTTAKISSHKAGTADETAGSDMTSRPACTILTLAESVIYGCTMLQKAYPDATIIVLTPLQSAAVPTDSISLAGDIMEGCCRRMGIGVIRQDGNDYINARLERRNRQLTTDGTHTNETGARHNARLIARSIKALLYKNE